MKALAASFLILTLIGCSTTPAPEPIPCPPRPVLIPISPELQRETPADVLDIVAANQIALKSHIRILEAYCEPL